MSASTIVLEKGNALDRRSGPGSGTAGVVITKAGMDMIKTSALSAAMAVFRGLSTRSIVACECCKYLLSDMILGTYGNIRWTKEEKRKNQANRQSSGQKRDDPKRT
jgi:hypothetical protein